MALGVGSQGSCLREGEGPGALIRVVVMSRRGKDLEGSDRVV